MSSHRLKRDREQSSSDPHSKLPQQLEKMSTPHVEPTSSPTLVETSMRPPNIPRVVRPILSSGSSSQMHTSISPASSSSQPQFQTPFPGTENSHLDTPQGSHATITPWGRDASDGRTWVYPEKKTFNPAVEPVCTILPIIQGKFDHPCCSWRATPPDYKKMWFAEWARKYKWLPQYEDAIKRNWNSKCADILKNTMHTIRQDLYKKQVRPKWILDLVMNELERIWMSEEYKSKGDIAKANRASTIGGTQHKGGSIPNTEHKRRMIKDMGREPSVFEVFKKTHYNEKTGQFAGHRAASIYDDFMRRKEYINFETGSPSVQSNEDEYNLWLEVTGGRNKKGRIYGFGSENEHIGCGSPPSINNTSIKSNIEDELRTKITELSQENQEIRLETQHLKKENQNLKQNFGMIVSALQGMGIQLPSPPPDNTNEGNEDDN